MFKRKSSKTLISNPYLSSQIKESKFQKDLQHPVATKKRLENLS